ncbi:electron transport complex subunit RsxG [Reinekea marinisedimentorum]|uniref:Ion-translocating oxidoreductase complex subunit G n=1 Tax=Reinekea marinisedimentorum TaxID=230495 RepID=A0A4R3I759_9GAMM|nr:electron transport complex subunit RsxG [Reinekea marinisedimentorum]TCS41976.1 electron transport complex protein RnfG [Reinekea marinisedimentorum]
MTDTAQITLGEAIRKSAIGLAIFAFFTAGIIAITQSLTALQISENEKNFEARQLLSLLPEGFEAEQLLEGARPLSSVEVQQLELLAVDASEPFFIAENPAGEVEAIILPVNAPEGYTESIRLIVGINTNGEVIGARVTKHKETPGLGDQVEITKSNWILGFNGKSLANPEAGQWQVKKDGGDFDQMTGATITPRAIVKAVKQALEFYQLNQTILLNAAQNQGANS